MKFKVGFANGRQTTISCDSNEEAKKELLSVQNRFNSKIILVNDQPIEKLSLGGVLLGAILGGILGNELAKSGVSKTAKTIKSTTKKTIYKTKKAIAEFRTSSSKPKKMSVERKFVNKSEDYEVRYAKKNNPSRVGYRGNKKYGLGGEVISNSKIAEKMEEIRTMSKFADEVRNFPTQITRKDLENILPDYVSGSDITKVLFKDSKFEGGGNVEEEVFIKYINKDKGFKPDTKEFNSYAEAMEWGKANIEKFNPDSINYKFAKGGGTPKKPKINKKYTHFAVNKETGKIRDAWETISDIETLKYYANIDLKDNDLNPKDFNIVSNKTLIRRGFDPYDSDNWTKTSEYATGGMSGMGMAAASPHLAIADQISQRLPATTAAIDKKFAERVNPTQPSMWEDRGLQKMAKGGGLNKFNFDKAELEKISSEYYNVYLYKNEKLIYKATVPTDDALMIADKYKNITLKKSFATGGIIGQEIVFDRWGETATGTITEKMANGNFSVVSGMSSYLVEPSQVISINPHTEKTKQGWFFADGGSVNTGLSWHQDRARHNKYESYELPLANRKKK